MENATEYIDEDELEQTDDLPEAIEVAAPTDRTAHLESGMSEYSRRNGGALISADIPGQFAELDRNLESEHAQNPDELGLAFLLGATQGEPAGELPEEDQPLRDPDPSDEDDTDL